MNFFSFLITSYKMEMKMRNARIDYSLDIGSIKYRVAYIDRSSKSEVMEARKCFNYHSGYLLSVCLS